MQKVFKAYMNRPWPANPAKKRKTSTDKNLPRCATDCTCSLYAECQQNAAAYISAAEYCETHPDVIDKTFKPNQKTFKPPTKYCSNKHHCAASGSEHRV